MNLRNRTLLLVAAGLACTLVPKPGDAQARYAGVQQAHISFGVEGSYMTPDFAPNRMAGVGGYADLDTRLGLGLEAEARFLRFNSFYGETQATYLVGPRYVFRHTERLQPFAKLLAGFGDMQYPFTIGSGSYFAIEAGGGVDYRLTRHWLVRGEYDYQFWPGSPGIAGEPSGSMLKPNGVTGGVAWRWR